jgi:transcriptional regulator
MYVPPAFKDDDIENIRATIRSARLANLVVIRPAILTP